MFTKTVYHFVTYCCDGYNFEQFQLARCMLSFRDAGIKSLEPICMAIIYSNEKEILFITLSMISISKMKNSVYNLIGLEDSCIYDHCLTEFFLSVEVTKDSVSMRLAQIYHKVTDCCIWPYLYC